MQAPKHYQDTKLMDLLIEKNVPFAEGNIMKYVYRWKEKDGLKDLYKAFDYLNTLIAHAELQKVDGGLAYPPIFNRRNADTHDTKTDLPSNQEQNPPRKD
jgi:hypothetical protein